MGSFWIVIITIFYMVAYKALADLGYAYFSERRDYSTSGDIGHYTPVSCAMSCLSLDCCETFHWNYMSQHCTLLTTDVWSTTRSDTESGHWKSYYMECATGWLEFNYHCYQLVTERMSWADAKLTCERNCAYLTEITDVEENDWIVESILNNGTCPGSNCQMWCGGNDHETEGNFQWSNSKMTMNFTNWKSGQPSLLYPERGEDRDCVSVYPNGLWNDSPCFNLKRFICEKH